MKARKRFIVQGSVQEAGFRAYVKMIALRMRIKGRIKNLDNEEVEIIAVGNSKIIDNLERV